MTCIDPQYIFKIGCFNLNSKAGKIYMPKNKYKTKHKYKFTVLTTENKLPFQT